MFTSYWAFSQAIPQHSMQPAGTLNGHRLLKQDLGSSSVTSKCKFSMTSPTALMINSLHCLSQPACLYTVSKELNTTPNLLVWLTNPALVRGPQSTPIIDPNKNMYRKSCLISGHSGLTASCGPSRCAVKFLQDLWLINFSISDYPMVYCWIMAHHPAPCPPLNKC